MTNGILQENEWYHGVEIQPCECEGISEGYRWRLVSYHHTGNVWSEAESYHSRTLAEMYDAIDEFARPNEDGSGREPVHREGSQLG